MAKILMSINPVHVEKILSEYLKIVDEMDSYVPGRSQDEIAQEFNLNKDEIIKLGSNENPWGPSPKAMEAIKNEIIKRIIASSVYILF